MSNISAASILAELATNMCLPILFEMISESGPSHCPTFRMRVTFGDLVVEANGKSKKDAKQESAAATLTVLAKNGIYNPGKKNCKIQEVLQETNGTPGQPVVSATQESIQNMIQSVSHELVSQRGPPHDPVFSVRVTIGEIIYEGEGKSKKEAKRNAIITAVIAKGGNYHSDYTKSNFCPSPQQSDNKVLRNLALNTGKLKLTKEPSNKQAVGGSTKIEEVYKPTETEKSIFLYQKRLALEDFKLSYSSEGPYNAISALDITNRHNSLRQSIDEKSRFHLKAYLSSELDSKDPVTKIENLLRMMKLDYKWILVPIKPIGSSKSVTYLHVTKCDPPLVIPSIPTLDSKTNAAQEAIEYFKDML